MFFACFFVIFRYYRANVWGALTGFNVGFWWFWQFFRFFLEFFDFVLAIGAC